MKYVTSKEEIADVIKQFLIADDWHFSFNEKNGIFDFDLKTKSKIQKINYLIKIHDNEIIVYGICPIGVDPDDTKNMAQMAEFICRANWGTKNGSFEFDFRDGEIRFKSFIDCDGILTSQNIVRNSIYYTAAMYKHYAVGITAIIFSDVSAKKAIEMCELSHKDDLLNISEQENHPVDSNPTSAVAKLTERLTAPNVEEFVPS